MIAALMDQKPPLAPYEPTEQNEQDLTRLVRIATAIIGNYKPDEFSQFFPGSEEKKLAEHATKVLRALKDTMRKERKHTPDPGFWSEYLRARSDEYTPYDFATDEARDGYVPWFRQQDPIQLNVDRFIHAGPQP